MPLIKKYLFILLLLMTIAPISTCMAEESKQSPFSGIDRIIKNGELRVAMTKEDLWPFYFAKPDGAMAGYDVELAKKIAKVLEVKTKFIRKGTHHDLVKLLDSNEADIIISAWSYSPQRALGAYVSRPYVKDYLAVLVNVLFFEKIKKESGDKKIKDISNILNRPGTRIGVSAGYIYDKWVNDLFPEAIRIDGTDQELDNKLVKGEIDAWVGVNSILYAHLKRKPELNLYSRKFELPLRDQFVVGVSRNNRDLYLWLESYFENILSSAPKDGKEIIDLYFAEEAPKREALPMALGIRALIFFTAIIGCLLLIFTGKKSRRSQKIPLLLDIRTLVSGIIIGCFTGWLFPQYVHTIEPVGTIYMKYLQMCAMPILFCCVALSVGKLCSIYTSPRLLSFFVIAIIAIFMIGSVLAIALGVTMNSGGKLPIETKANLALSINEQQTENKLPEDDRLLFWRVLDEAIQPSFVKSLSLNNSLSILFVAILVGIGIASYGGKTIITALEKIEELVLWLFFLSLHVLPFALLSIMSKSIVTIKENSLFNVLVEFNLQLGIGYVLIFILGLIMVSIGWKCKPLKALLILKETLLTGFSTESAIATIPLAQTACHKLDKDNKIDSDMVPLWVIFPQIAESFMFVAIVLFVLQIFGFQLYAADYFYLLTVGTVCSISTIGIKPPMHLLALVMLTSAYSLPFGMVFTIAISTEMILGRFAGVASFMVGFGAMPLFDRWANKK